MSDTTPGAIDCLNDDLSRLLRSLIDAVDDLAEAVNYQSMVIASDNPQVRDRYLEKYGMLSNPPNPKLR